MKNMEPKEIISIAQRENNQKRAYLFVNHLQAKHIPVSPSEALKLFDKLSKQVYDFDTNKKTTIIGFAETATAIGSAVANASPSEVYYIHTSREKLPKEDIVVQFQEEHSHATEQILYCHKKKEMLFEAERILFVEDEITTGKTILNFINALKAKGIQAQFGACSIANSMEKEHREIFLKNNITLYQLFTLEKKLTEREFLQETVVAEKKQLLLPRWIEYQTIFGKINPRLGCFAKEYHRACLELAERIYTVFSKKIGENILVLGTEECMYPAIMTAYYFEKMGKNVKTHSTTRSPIVPRKQQQYPIFNRSSFESFYEKGRKTYLYNLTKYDTVIIVTDVDDCNKTGLNQLLQVLKTYENDNIMIIRWKIE